MLLASAFAATLTPRCPLRLLWIGLLLLCLPCLFLTQSRTAMVSAAAAMLGVIIIAKKWKVLIVYGLLISVYFAPVWLVAPFLPGDVADDVTVREFNFETRDYVWQRQMDAFTQKPFLGHGFEIRSQDEEAGRTGGEGSYTDLLAAVGILGCAPLFLAFGYGAWLLLQWAQEREQQPSREGSFPFHLATFSIVLVILVNSMAEGFLAAVGCTQAIYTWAMLGAASELRNPSRGRAAPPPHDFAYTELVYPRRVTHSL
jgi:O-antigen ligase